MTARPEYIAGSYGGLLSSADHPTSIRLLGQYRGSVLGLVQSTRRGAVRAYRRAMKVNGIWPEPTIVYSINANGYMTPTLIRGSDF